MPEMVLVRARVREDLERIGELIGPLTIEHTPEADYAYRATVTRERWSACLGQLASEIDYPNFKDAVAARQGYERAATYHRVWSDLAALQH